MKYPQIAASLTVCALSFGLVASTAAQSNNPGKPTWWAKYQFLAANGPDTCTGDASLVARRGTPRAVIFQRHGDGRRLDERRLLHRHA